MKVEIKILNKEFYDLDHDTDHEEHIIGPLPSYATAGSAAVDLICTEDVTLYPGERKMIHTGLALWMGAAEFDGRPVSAKRDGSFSAMSIAGLILPRSGLGTQGLVLANTVGLIDEDYQGELMVSIWNSNPICPSNEDIEARYINECSKVGVKRGERFAQLVFIPVIKAQWNIVDDFSVVTERNTGGWGSTG